MRRGRSRAERRDAIGRAVTDDDLDADAAAGLNQGLDQAEASLSAGELARGANDQ